MKQLVVYVVLLIVSATAAIAGERYTMTGIVRDAVTRDTLAAAIVRVLGTSMGTITNAQGRFSIALESGDHRLAVSSLGYRPDTVAIQLTGPMSRDVFLEPLDIILPEVVVTSEDPALAIIRQAIASKRKWSERLHSYEMEAFTRQVLFRDTAIASINESYTRGFWQYGDTLREVVRQQRQTENVRGQFGVAAVGRILNFAEDRIRFVGYSFVGPIADDALDHYAYKLLGIRSSEGQEFYEIAITPRRRTTPLFQGTLQIAGGSYALISVDVAPNEAFIIPFVKEKLLRYRQGFALYDRTYWMPVDIRIAARFTLGVPGLSFPPIALEQTSVIYDYVINPEIPDTIFAKPRITVDSVALRADTALWMAAPVLPLSAAEQNAYATLDTTKRLDVQFRPGGVTATLGTGGGALGTVLEVFDGYFNRVEGFHVGLKYEAKELLSWADIRGGFSYGFSDTRGKYLAGATIYATKAKRYGIGADAYRRVDHRPDQGYYGTLLNTCTSLLARNDYRDYYEAEGWRGFAVFHPSSELTGELSFVAEEHRSRSQATDYSFFAHSRQYRPNPSTLEGQLRSVRLDARLGEEAVPLELVWRNSLEVQIEHSAHSLAHSDYDFTRYSAIASMEFHTFGEGFLLQPSLRIRLAAGATAGPVPPQRTFDLESSSSGYGPFGVLRGVRVKEFSGTSYVALTAEHNFRSTPFLWLDIPFLYENGIELLVTGGAARAWDKGTPGLAPTVGWYYEMGVGVGRIFELLRADLTWRFVEPRHLVFTVGMAGIL